MRWFPLVVLLVGTLSGASAVAQEDYDIGPNDVLHVIVLAQPEMSGDFTVEADGMLTFPFLGKVKATGMTPRELEKKLTTLLADGYLKRPQAAVTVKEYRSQRIFVAGDIPRPGPYSLRVDRTLLGLLAEVGALGPNVGHELVLTRPAQAPTSPQLFDLREDGSASGDPLPFPVPTPEVIHVNIRELQSGNPESNLPLSAGDSVLFPRAANIYVSGHVGRPGPYRYQEGMTVLQALSQAGGATERGAEGRTKLVRLVDGKKVETKAEPTDVLQPEDSLVVPERFF